MKRLNQTLIWMTFIQICTVGRLTFKFSSCINDIAKYLEIREGNKTIIQDRTIYEDAAIFAPNLHKMGLMSTRDYENYKAFYKTVEAQIQPPDLLIYMKASIPTLVTIFKNEEETMRKISD